jgi:hypothetical protein
MDKKKKDKCQTPIYKTLYRKQELLIIYFNVIRFDVKKEIIIITGIYKFQIWSNLW